MTTYLLARVGVLGVTAAALLFAVPPLVRQQEWTAFAILLLSTLGIGYLYLSKRHIAAKYLVPGTLLLLAFQVFPVIYTASTAFTNFGDGHRGSKQEAITAIERESYVEGKEFQLKIATKGGDLVFVLTDENGVAKLGTPDGLGELSDVERLPAGERDLEVQAFAVPTDRGVIKASGLTRAIEFIATRKYDESCDCIVGEKRWTANDETGYFEAADGTHLIQGWRVNVGLANFTRVFTDASISGPFAGVFGWNLVFALLSVFVTFALGTVVALVLHTPKMRFAKVYRIILILPYAMPAFAMLLVWRDMFNKDFGLFNRLFGTDVDWMGEPLSARFALILVNLWLGFPYMFLVATGALQSIPRELTDAAGIDGANRWQAFRKITLPLLLVALTPLLISSFAFNFNNFNVIQLVTGGGPFPADNAQVGATDLLITYTYRLAFGTSGAQFGFAAAISVFIFTLVAGMSAIAFRRSRAQEEIYS